MKKGFVDKIIVGISVNNKKDLLEFLDEIKKHNLTRVALFLEDVSFGKRKEFCSLLLDSNIKEIPLVHIYEDYKKEELLFFIKNFKTKFFTIHESDFNYLDDWKGLHKRLFLEMNYDNDLGDNVKVEKIGGFCIDFAHFMVSMTSNTKEYHYIKKRLKKPLFKCNHINGYNKKENIDVHDIRSLKDFDYLFDLPKEIFSDVIALEVHNSIKEQLVYKKYLVKILDKKFKEEKK